MGEAVRGDVGVTGEEAPGRTGAEPFAFVGVLGAGADGWSDRLGVDELADADRPEGLVGYDDGAGAAVRLRVRTGELCGDVVGVAVGVRESDGDEGEVNLGREVERGGGLGDGGVGGRAAFSLNLSSRSLVRTRSPSRDVLGASAVGVDMLTFLSLGCSFDDGAALARVVRSSARTVSPAAIVGREDDEESEDCAVSASTVVVVDGACEREGEKKDQVDLDLVLVPSSFVFVFARFVVDVDGPASVSAISGCWRACSRLANLRRPTLLSSFLNPAETTAPACLDFFTVSLSSDIASADARCFPLSLSTKVMWVSLTLCLCRKGWDRSSALGFALALARMDEDMGSSTLWRGVAVAEAGFDLEERVPARLWMESRRRLLNVLDGWLSWADGGFELGPAPGGEGCWTDTDIESSRRRGGVQVT